MRIFFETGRISTFGLLTKLKEERFEGSDVSLTGFVFSTKLRFFSSSCFWKSLFVLCISSSISRHISWRHCSRTVASFTSYSALFALATSRASRIVFVLRICSFFSRRISWRHCSRRVASLTLYSALFALATSRASRIVFMMLSHESLAFISSSSFLCNWLSKDAQAS